MLVGATLGDAITNEAFQLQRLFRRLGPSEIFCQYIGDGVEGVRFLSQYAAMDSSRGCANVLVVHSSIGEPAVYDFLQSRPERVVLRFHNISPPGLFERYDPAFARILAEGHRELAGLRDRVVLSLAVSGFNASTLDDLGFDNVRVAPLLLDLEGLVATEPAELPGRPLPQDGPLVLFVGRVAPNKGYHELLKAFHVLKTYRQPDAQLWCVGGKAHGVYRSALDAFISGLGLRDVVFTGPISDAHLAAVFRRADVYLSLSAHEGFCVPLVEAMAHGIPVVAWNNTAVGETVGDAGVLLDSPAPAPAAEAVTLLLEDRGLRDELVARGKQRAAHFTSAQASAAFLDALLELA